MTFPIVVEVGRTEACIVVGLRSLKVEREANVRRFFRSTCRSRNYHRERKAFDLQCAKLGIDAAEALRRWVKTREELLKCWWWYHDGVDIAFEGSVLHVSEHAVWSTGERLSPAELREIASSLVENSGSPYIFETSGRPSGAPQWYRSTRAVLDVANIDPRPIVVVPERLDADRMARVWRAARSPSAMGSHDALKFAALEAAELEAFARLPCLGPDQIALVSAEGTPIERVGLDVPDERLAEAMRRASLRI